VRGRCETVVSQGVGVAGSQVPVWRRKSAVDQVGVGKSFQSLRDARRLAEESLAVRRDMENKVAARKAELLLSSLNDKKKCQDYDDLKRQRVIQWQNQSLAKTQISAKSLDPDSSVSMREFREQTKRCSDLEYKQKKND